MINIGILKILKLLKLKTMFIIEFLNKTKEKRKEGCKKRKKNNN